MRNISRFIDRQILQIRNLLRSRSGAVMPMVGIGIIALVGATAVAVDTARVQLVQSRLSNALDAAGLAAGATLNTASIQTEATKYLNANFQNYLGSTLTNTSVQANADNSVITLSATATVPLVLMPVLGQSTSTVSASSQITRASKGLELVMVLDNTGSMTESAGTATKIDALKSAATELVNILFGSTTPTNLWIGLVPFSQGVNIGSSRTSWLDQTYFNSLNWHSVAWGGCVDARSNGADVTDATPSSQLFKAYYWPDDSNNDWVRNNGNVRSGIGSTLGPNKQCPQSLLPMTSNQTSIINSINAMQATGDTIIGEGAVWGWRMLSPNWRGLWGGEMNQNNLPLDYNTQNMNKAIVLITDGDNTIDNSNDGAYGYLSQNLLGSTNQSTAQTTMNNRFLSVCTAMKNNNIFIYTIAVGTSISTTGKSILQSCASQPAFYFESPDAATLQTAFQAIGDSLSNLRISM